MATERIDVNIPAAKCAVAAHATPGGDLIPGALIVTARCAGREEETERIGREHEGRNVRRGEVAADGEVPTA